MFTFCLLKGEGQARQCNLYDAAPGLPRNQIPKEATLPDDHPSYTITDFCTVERMSRSLLYSLGPWIPS
jgi:hypothetical protein